MSLTEAQGDDEDINEESLQEPFEEDLEEELRRVRFYSVHDLSGSFYFDRVAEIAERFVPASMLMSTVDVLELHNVIQFLENNLLPLSFTDAQREQARSKIRSMSANVARHFTQIDDENCSVSIADVPHDYRADLIDLLGRNGAFLRCAASVLLPVLREAGLHLRELLANKKLVNAYDAEMREQILASPHNAELLIHKYLLCDVSDEINLPPSLTPDDSRELLKRYIDNPDAHPSYVKLIERAPAGEVTNRLRIDDKLRIYSKRRHAELNERFFESASTFKTGCEVGVSDTQHLSVVEEIDESDGGLVCRYTYSSHWLQHTDHATILNNFWHLFEFAGRTGILTLPSYRANLGFVDTFLTTSGPRDYQIGAAFRAIDLSSLLQTRVYHHFLAARDIDLETVVAWFFETYLREEFGAPNFSFTPSGDGTSYLQKVRHLFAEMESVAAQFALFARDGELDLELLTVSTDQVRYAGLPSMLVGKYLYSADNDDITFILRALFSDQSGLTYIKEDLRDDSLFKLITRHHVAYDDLHAHQKPAIDQLVDLGIVASTDTRIRLAREQVLILHSLHAQEAVSYYHLSRDGRAAADDMESRGWLTPQSTLLTAAEANYFDYLLNNIFSNGPQLRNRYVHGKQGNTEGEDAHFYAYMVALRLTMALLIKINDDFCLAAALFEPTDN